jgi:RNA polymerase sigma-70 factor (ECF subfamily)
LHSFAGRSSFATWLHSIAVHVVIEQQRGRKLWLELGGDALADRQPAPLVNDEQILDIETLILSLPEGARCVVVLQGIYGYSHEEVAAMLGIAVGTCKAQLHRARALLRAQYDSPELS